MPELWPLRWRTTASPASLATLCLLSFALLRALNVYGDAADTIEEWFHEAGWELISKTDRVNPPGYSIHEMGTCRMGDDPKKSVLNKWCQSHDIKNLFVVDAASFVTAG